MDLNKFAERSFKLSMEKGWYKKRKDGSLKARNIPEMLALIHSEVSEALEEYRKGRMGVYYNAGSGKPEGFPIEMADALIRIGDLMRYLKYDTNYVVNLKHKYNATRPHRHGGKKC